MHDPKPRVGEALRATTGPMPLRALSRGLNPVFTLPGQVRALPENDHWAGLLARLDIAFQPIVNIHTGVCYGVEALLRNVGEAGFDSIRDFFDTCHALGVLEAVEEALREKAVAKFAAIPHHRVMRLFVNLDGRALEDGDGLPTRTVALLARHGIERDALVVELSERHHPVGAPDELAVHVQPLRRHGFRLAIDDFGTGFSGLPLLYFAEPDVLKIDRFFLADIATDAKKRLFLSQIVHIAHLLGTVVVAEGVETEREYFVCRDIGCDLVQGWLIQHPTCACDELRLRYDRVEHLARQERRVAISDQKLIGDQIAYIPPLTLDTGMEDVFQRFRHDKGATFFPVVDAAGEPQGIVREKDLKAYAYSPFGKELMCNKAFGRTLRDFVTRCPMADINSRAETVLQAFSAVEGTEGILILDDMKYVGFLSAPSLLRVINEKNLATARDQNPLTKLPGNTLIHEYVSEALADTGAEAVLAYFDFDNFKPFNDKYGFRLGDRAILLFAELLAKALPRDTCFIGHIGGDDFFAGFRGLGFEEAERQCVELVATFRRDVESFYDDDSRRRGGIAGHDRLGNAVTFPLMTVSAALVHLPAGRAAHTADEVSRLIAALKKDAKASPTRVCAATLTRPQPA